MNLFPLTTPSTKVAGGPKVYYRLIYREWTNWISFKNHRMLWLGETISSQTVFKLGLINSRKQLGDCFSWLKSLQVILRNQLLSGLRWWMFYCITLVHWIHLFWYHRPPFTWSTRGVYSANGSFRVGNLFPPSVNRFIHRLRKKKRLPSVARSVTCNNTKVCSLPAHC